MRNEFDSTAGHGEYAPEICNRSTVFYHALDNVECAQREPEGKGRVGLHLQSCSMGGKGPRGLLPCECLLIDAASLTFGMHLSVEHIRCWSSPDNPRKMYLSIGVHSSVSDCGCARSG
jgi:hypothetical protein